MTRSSYSSLRTLLALSVVHWLTSVGVVLTTASAIVFLTLAFLHFQNPYFGIVVFLFLPALFVLGLILMPLGLFFASRRPGGFQKVLDRVPELAPRAARLAWALVLATFANVAILGAAAYRGVDYMDSARFCGQTCHSVMQPQYVRYQKSPHARVPCVDCHVGSGASSFVQYKLAGVRQLVRLTNNTYARPIPGAMDSMRPSADTCEHCHSAQTAKADKLEVIRHFDNDEKSTEKVTVLTIHIGKIHRAHRQGTIQYTQSGSDSQEIATVTAGGQSFSAEGVQSMGRSRTMDCLDCHNRTGHDFETAESAVDRAIAEGLIDRSRPFVRRDAAAALKRQSGLESEPAPIRSMLSENVFPNMMISWGTYPSNIGHEKFPGCFRCHDGQHVTKSGDAITQDCNACHEPVVVDEENPKILKDIGLQ